MVFFLFYKNPNDSYGMEKLLGVDMTSSRKERKALKRKRKGFIGICNYGVKPSHRTTSGQKWVHLIGSLWLVI